MIRIEQVANALRLNLPETAEWLTDAGLAIHPSVAQVVLHGSRGLAQNFRADSDLDISLVVPFPSPPAISHDLERTLREIAEVTWNAWEDTIQLDLAVVFPRKRCNFECFERIAYDPEACQKSGPGCFGVFKGHGEYYPEFTLNADVSRMYPCITVWKS
jgi:predicted nucleotidyltransferase